MVCGSCILLWLCLTVGGLVALVKVYTRITVGRCTSKRNLSGRVAIVTGSNVGIGLETVKELVMRNAKVIMACRSMERGKEALETVIRETDCDPSLVILKQLDLSSLASVRQFASEIVAHEQRLDILVNNAGATIWTKTLTADGLETCMAANHFGPFLLTNLLLGLMQKSPQARIVNVSSAGHAGAGQLDLDNLNSEKEWNPWRLYPRTKLANVLFTRELDRRLKAAGVRNVTVNALHPGGVKSGILRKSEEIWYWNLWAKILQFFFKETEEGAQTSVYLAVAAELDDVSGGYFDDCAPAKISSLAQDDDLARKLFDASARAVKLQVNESIVFDTKSNYKSK